MSLARFNEMQEQAARRLREMTNALASAQAIVDAHAFASGPNGFKDSLRDTLSMLSKLEQRVARLENRGTSIYQGLLVHRDDDGSSVDDGEDKSESLPHDTTPYLTAAQRLSDAYVVASNELKAAGLEDLATSMWAAGDQANAVDITPDETVGTVATLNASAFTAADNNDRAMLMEDVRSKYRGTDPEILNNDQLTEYVNEASEYVGQLTPERPISEYRAHPFGTLIHDWSRPDGGVQTNVEDDVVMHYVVADEDFIKMLLVGSGNITSADLIVDNGRGSTAGHHGVPKVVGDVPPSVLITFPMVMRSASPVKSVVVLTGELGVARMIHVTLVPRVDASTRFRTLSPYIAANIDDAKKDVIEVCFGAPLYIMGRGSRRMIILNDTREEIRANIVVFRGFERVMATWRGNAYVAFFSDEIDPRSVALASMQLIRVVAPTEE